MRIKSSLFSAFLLLFITFPLAAQEAGPVNIGLMARVDYQREWQGGDAVKDNCGFKGKNVSIVIGGDLGGISPTTTARGSTVATAASLSSTPPTSCT